MLQSIKKLLSTFEKEDIKYCHWKSNEHLQAALNGDTDLDMLVNPSQRGQIEEILNKCGLKRFRATPHMQYNAIEDFIGFDKETAKIWHLHLHYRLTLGEKHLKGYTTPWGNYILENRVYNEEFEVFCSSVEDEYFLLLLRISLKLRWRDYKRKLGKDEIVEIRWLKERADSKKVVEIAKKLIGYKTAKEYEKILDKNMIYKRDFYKLRRLLRMNMKEFTSNSLVTSYLKRTVREFNWIISGVSRRVGLTSEIPKRRVSPSGGTVVAIIGCDGAGKSTTIAYLTKEFGKKIDIKNEYLGSGDGRSSILRYPMRLVAKRVSGKGLGASVKQELNSENSKISFKARIYSVLKILWAILLAVEKKKKLKKIVKARNNGILVLVDRYPQVEVMGYNDGPLLSKYLERKNNLMKKMAIWEMNVYKRAYINPPDLVVKLMVPTQVAIERKPEMTVSEIEDKKAAVKKINLSSNSVEIDTSQDKTSSFGEVMEEIWKVI